MGNDTKTFFQLLTRLPLVSLSLGLRWIGHWEWGSGGEEKSRSGETCLNMGNIRGSRENEEVTIHLPDFQDHRSTLGPFKPIPPVTTPEGNVGPEQRLRC